jgi:hypothetical protein
MCEQCSAPHIKIKNKKWVQTANKIQDPTGRVRLERLSALYHTSTTAPTSHSHRFPNQGMEANFFLLIWSDACKQQHNSSQLTDTSTYWHLRSTWFQIDLILLMPNLWFHGTLSQIQIQCFKPGGIHISSVSKNYFFQGSCCTFLVQQKGTGNSWAFLCL